MKIFILILGLLLIYLAATDKLIDVVKVLTTDATKLNTKR